MIDLTMTYHTPSRGRVLPRSAVLVAGAAVCHARELLVKSRVYACWRQIVGALRLSYDRRIIRKIFSFFVLWLRIMGARLKR